MMNETPKLVASIFFSRVLPSVGGALLGSLLALSFFLMVEFAAQSVSGSETMILSGFIIFGVAFLAVLFSNILATIFLALSSGEQFGGKFRQAISHIFFMNAGLMAVSSPLYLLLSSENGFLLSRFFLPFSAIASILLYDVYANPKNAVLGAQKAIISGVVVALLFFFFFPRLIPNEVISFFLLPIVWSIIPIVSVVIDWAFLTFFRK